MNNAIAIYSRNNQVGQNNRQIVVVRTTPNSARIKAGAARRKLALLAVSIALCVALSCVVVIIGTSSAEAAHLATFTPANALSAKQDSGIASIATASLALAACSALAVIAGKR